MLAANIGVPFHTPDEFFLGEAKAPFDWDTFDAKQFLAGMASPPLVTAGAEFGEQTPFLPPCPW
jgi:bifunctional polynucleotide phosphatase/kinase